MFGSFDAWKLATPPHYEDGPADDEDPGVIETPRAAGPEASDADDIAF